MDDLDDCIKRGLIRETAPSRGDALKSFEKAGRALENAKAELKIELFEPCVIASYVSMFHATRAILINDGFREKSHYCIARYLEETYADKGKLDINVIYLLDRFRELRHDAVYDINYVATERDAVEALKNAELILNSMEKLLI